jgi:SAM-dependent methyltransferase
MGRPRICCARAAQDHAAPPTLSEKAATRRRSIACPRASRWSPPKYGEWREGTAEALPFPDRSFDVAVSQFGLMFFTDRDKAIHEMLRVQADAASLQSGMLSRTPHHSRSSWACLIASLERPLVMRFGRLSCWETGGRSPRCSAAPEHRLSISRPAKARPGSAARVSWSKRIRGWLPVMGVVLPEPEISLIVAEAEKVLAPYVTRDGAIAFSMSAHLVSSRKP